MTTVRAQNRGVLRFTHGTYSTCSFVLCCYCTSDLLIPYQQLERHWDLDGPLRSCNTKNDHVLSCYVNRIYKHRGFHPGSGVGGRGDMSLYTSFSNHWRYDHRPVVHHRRRLTKPEEGPEVQKGLRAELTHTWLKLVLISFLVDFLARCTEIVSKMNLEGCQIKRRVQGMKK